MHLCTAAIDVQKARGPIARHKTRFFGPAQARHGPVAGVPGPPPRHGLAH